MAPTTAVTAATPPSEAVYRFVPQGQASLVDDAPGWEDNDGPTCWKCKGIGTTGMPKLKKRNKKRKAPGIEETQDQIAADEEKSPEEPVETRPTRKQCPVCNGRGHLLKRKVPETVGRITRGRKRLPEGWLPTGPEPAKEKEKLQKANEEYVDIECPDGGPAWLPRRGEELCNLVGTWRILQRVGSHRWTTDDLVTAWLAQSVMTANEKQQQLHYLDLGTGNASVLQMTTWALLKDGCDVKAIGVEARSEAVALARRSLEFNLGTKEGDGDDAVARIVHGDFRDVRIKDRKFDLVTGTPPYFRVDFSVTNSKGVVSKAVINQGGMPTAKQSAPARCEFRGGIEAYCEAAARVLKQPHGRFVVCENWLNHDRVVAAAKACELQIIKQVEVLGKEKAQSNLFAVYVMRKKESSTSTETPTDLPETVVQALAVRTATGEWTKDYKDLVLKSMSIPFA